MFSGSLFLGDTSNALTVSLHVFCCVLFVGWAFLVLCHMFGLFYGLYKFHRKPASSVKELPGVSIIKPLTGADPNLYENLKTFFNLTYPRYELLFCVQEEDEKNNSTSTINGLTVVTNSGPGPVEIVNKLRAEYPHVESKLFIGGPTKASAPSNSIPNGGEKIAIDGEEEDDYEDIKNPKIYNMLPAYEAVQYPLFLVSDSGLMMHENTLYEMALLMGDNVGLVHQMPFTCDRTGFSASVEKVYFGTQHARMYMTINMLGINCVTGMSCLIRKECIDRVGGLRAFGQWIAEDYYIAYEVAKQGWKVRVSHTPALQNSGDYSISTWTERMIRWCKLRMRLSPLAFLEPLQECFSSALLAGVVTSYMFEWNALVVSACHILVWFIADYLMLRITQGGPLPFSKFEFTIAWLFREVSSFYIYFKAFTGSAIIRWRGREFLLGRGTRVMELPKKSSTMSSSRSSPPPAPSLVEDCSSLSPLVPNCSSSPSLVHVPSSSTTVIHLSDSSPQTIMPPLKTPFFETI